MPKVSVVLPNYNYAKYLDERIQSLLNQTYTDFELIIVDDASPDNSLEVIEKYTGDQRVKTLFFTENSGLPYKRWNDGAKLATGDYILFAGADDSCEPTLLEKLVEKLDANPNVGIAFSQSWEMTGEGKTIRSLKIHTDDLNEQRWAQDFVDQGTTECHYMIIKNTIPNASAALLRRQIFEQCGRFDENLRLVADWMLWCQMLLISDIAFVAEPLNYFRKHRKTVRSHSQQYGSHILEEIQVVSYLSNHANIPDVFLEKAYNKIVNRWVNSTVRLAFTKPDKALARFREIHGLVTQIDNRVNQRIAKRVLKDVFTLGIPTMRERSFSR
jgi:glycosyltransferase involved in cell wall biosynthesis